MTSTLGCVGLACADDDALLDLVERTLPDARPVAHDGDVTTLRWLDRSGACLTVAISPEGVQEVVPSYAGPPGMRFAGVFTLREETVAADVVDDEGEVTTRMACELLQWRRLPSGGVAGPASVTAFGLDVGVYADPDAYLASPASLLTPERADEPPPDDLGEGIAWPPRMDAQSFLSYGIFGEPAEAQPHARLAGVVTAATTHRVALTGQDFHAVRLLSLGLSFDLCLAATDHDLPGPGQVVAGTVLLVASMDALWEAGPSTATRRRRWWRRG